MTENNGFMLTNNQSTRQLKPKKLKYCWSTTWHAPSSKKNLSPHHGTAQAGPSATDLAREREIRRSRPRPNPDLLRQREIRPTCVDFQPDLSFSHPDPTPTSCDRERYGRCAWVSGRISLSLTPTQHRPLATKRDPAGLRGFMVGSLFLSPRPLATERDPAGMRGFPARSLFLTPWPNPDHLRQRKIRPMCVGFRPNLSFSHLDHQRLIEIQPVCSFFWSNLILAYVEEIHWVFWFYLILFFSGLHVNFSLESKKCLVSAMAGLKLFPKTI
jgi:hypothetical protein